MIPELRDCCGQTREFFPGNTRCHNDLRHVVTFWSQRPSWEGRVDSTRLNVLAHRRPPPPASTCRLPQSPADLTSRRPPCLPCSHSSSRGRRLRRSRLLRRRHHLHRCPAVTPSHSRVLLARIRTNWNELQVPVRRLRAVISGTFRPRIARKAAAPEVPGGRLRDGVSFGLANARQDRAPDVARLQVRGGRLREGVPPAVRLARARLDCAREATRLQVRGAWLREGVWDSF